jgi:hypothetical protein
VVRVTAKVRLQSNMAADLPPNLIIVIPQKPDEFVTGQITGQSQAEMTSSFTVCSRITAGACPSSKWHRTASRTLAFN